MKRNLLIAAMLAAVVAISLFALLPARQDKGPLVLAASSMQEAMEAAADAWGAKRHARPVLSFAGTSALARQVEAGAPADIIVSADEQWMNELARKDLIRHRTRADLAGNGLVIVEQAGKDTRIDIVPGPALASALHRGKLAMADPDAVPAGRYARQALTHFGVWHDVEPDIVATENVRVAAALVAKGEAPLGIVYATDARADPRLRVVAPFPPESHAPITYPLALLKTSENPDAEGFRQFLLSDEAAAIFRSYGFTTGSGR